MLLFAKFLLISLFVNVFCQFGGIYGYDPYGIPPPVPPPMYPPYPYGYGYGGYGFMHPPGSIESIIGGALMGTAAGLLYGKKK
ncbi:unnamed protein product [Strongylus vulgaris]|uniref:Uncharacterized protein n=1 Tax=Strongylus vulgaris TaxID=40348 RepID=A0A3P7L1F9_STRVU|nr:unnamed protein product [Strongylus vulgaris]